ncbi:gametogenetin [Brachypodium distachyon]|uniref:VQ domain-containing protein n=1 Tax=Brachypodium distachyon TaxID=15368 RepID=A0A0Q3LIT7_BRADI|nr:gametogenetin [Brachypodium distachyon]KQJ92453.1 hypothetical protein BRADI_4g43770v3 [Brachypodium distachyon]|eukprot:XP_014757919.1 gametogenetin [Brachypodium distachyon]
MLSAMMQQQQRTASASAYAYTPPPLPSASAWQGLPSPPSYEAPAAHQQQHRPRRAATKRRPRPSRRTPTTYIRAGPAEFRRMVHQVTGADDIDLLLNPPPPPPPQQQQAAAQPLRRLPCRPAPVPAAGALMLPTLDTSASFLLAGGGCRARTPAAAPTEAPPPPPASEGSLDLDDGGAGFPTLDSWDLL